jgi:type II restriction enzyme
VTRPFPRAAVWRAHVIHSVGFAMQQLGWTLDVLNVVRSLQKPAFELSEVYAKERELAKLHPQNRHVRDKIRQRLQVLRDLGILEFLGNGTYRLR